LTRVHLDGVTILIATPYLDEAERCTQVGLLHRGELIALDTPAALRANLHATVLEGQTSRAREARSLAANQPGVLDASMHGEMVRLLVDRAERQTQLLEAWREHGIDVQNLQIVTPRLEDAFVLTVEERTEDGGRRTEDRR
jgi:ABC-2 type transport system ATP-binding protein